jgi:dipeptidyl aminopeptidase/acylaminoacyl peptidase
MTRVKWWIAGAAVVLAIVSVLVIRAGFQPCAWLDVALKRSGCLSTLEEHSSRVDSVAFSPDGALLASGSRDNMVRLWRVADKDLVRVLENPVPSSEEGGYSQDVAFSPGGEMLAFGSTDGAVRLWWVSEDEEHPAGTLLHILPGQLGKVCSLAFSPDGRILAAGTWNGPVRLWQVSDGTLLRTLNGHTMGVVSVAFSPDGMALVSASLDGTTRLWSTSSGALVHNLEHPSVVTGVAFSPDGSILATDQKLWRVDDWTFIREMESTKGGLGNVAFSPDGKTLAAGDASYGVRWWRVADGSLLRAVKGHVDSVNSVAFSPDGFTMASGSLDGKVRLWQVPEGGPESRRLTPVEVQSPTGQEVALQSLMNFFRYLKAGQYAEASQLYGGSYEPLIDSNPGLEPGDHAALLRNACTVNGFQCLRVRSAHLQDQAASGAEFQFKVEFSTPEGELFVRGPCCGASETDMPWQSEFTFSVVRSEDGVYRVQELPVYVP